MPGLLKITFESMVTGGTADPFTSDTVGMPDADPAVKPNAKQTNVGGDFPHLFDISSEGARVLVFTDKEQETPEVVAVTAMTLVNAAVTAEQITSLGESSDGGTSFPGTYDHDKTTILPRLRERSRVLVTPAHWLYGQRGRCHGHDRDRLHVFRKQGRRYGCGKLLRRPTTSSSVSGWMK